MIRSKSNKRNRICLNLLAILSKSGMAMAVPAIPVATAHYKTWVPFYSILQEYTCSLHMVIYSFGTSI